MIDAATRSWAPLPPRGSRVVGGSLPRTLIRGRGWGVARRSPKQRFLLMDPTPDPKEETPTRNLSLIFVPQGCTPSLCCIINTFLAHIMLGCAGS